TWARMSSKVITAPPLGWCLFPLLLRKMTHFPNEGKRRLHIASLSPEPVVGTAWNRSVCTIIVPTMSRECGRAFHSQEQSALGRHLRDEERLEYLRCFHPWVMAATTMGLQALLKVNLRLATTAY